MCPPTLIVPAWRRETKMSKGRRSGGGVFDGQLGANAAVSITAYDGSSSGPADAPVAIRVCSPLALDYLMSSPGDLGLARGYVSGALDVSGDLYTALRTLSDQVDQLSSADRLWLLRTLGPRHLRRVRPPAQELPGRFRRGFSGLRHSRARDSDAISTHYDVSNRFYELVLGPSMAYTCAVFPAAGSSLEQAQASCRQPGTRRRYKPSTGRGPARRNGWRRRSASKSRRCPAPGSAEAPRTRAGTYRAVPGPVAGLGGGAGARAYAATRAGRLSSAGRLGPTGYAARCTGHRRRPAHRTRSHARDRGRPARTSGSPARGASTPGSPPEHRQGRCCCRRRR